MTRRQKERRRVVESRITAEVRQEEASRWVRTRARLAAQRVRTRAALRAAGSGGLLSAMCILVVVSMIPGCLTLAMVRDAMVLEVRGVRVTAQVVYYRTAGRGPDTVTVRSLGPPSFETDLDRWPRGLGVGQQIDVVYDPRDPGLAVGVGAPRVDLGVLVLAAFDLLGLVLLLTALLPAGELVRRGWARARGDRAPRVAGDAADLEASGVHARATVERSSWGAGGHWLDLRFSLPNGAQVSSSVTARDRVSYEGDTLDVLYLPDDPRNVQIAGDAGWQIQARLAAGAFVVCAAGALVAVSLAVAELVRRARRARAVTPDGRVAG